MTTSSFRASSSSISCKAVDACFTLIREIAFEDDEDQGIVQRAWEGLIPNRILIYCLEHLIDDELCTPDRNHIKFPDDGQQKKKQASQQLSSKVKVLQKERNLASQDAPRKRTHEKVQKGVDLSSKIKEGNSSEKRVRLSTGLDTSKKQKVADTSRRPLNNTAATKVGKSTTDANRASLGERLYALINKDSRNEDTSDSEHKQTLPDKPVAKEMSSSVPLDDDRKRRILALMKDATSSITLEEITKKHKVPITHAYSSKNVVDKAITVGKALRAALQKLEKGCSIEDATAVFQPVLLHQMVRWKIVDVLHSYVQNGDMVLKKAFTIMYIQRWLPLFYVPSLVVLPLSIKGWQRSDRLDGWVIIYSKMVPYITTALMDAKLGTEGRKDFFDWLSRQLSGLSKSVNLNENIE
ncbi:Protein ENHANCED DOWNY MILDEW 2 [Camellia lanceoleosa]|uniref:Protein ENHANCED DOWNY MILDEW 2 n=1 Tax=Camellia lanceoleosa TaxID=1840588 RepID=A0ACC0GTS2_9ERIC|nr:Protein ENHANCED DOWNY MILDEW 2 [Camellia lanceoleosa]